MRITPKAVAAAVLITAISSNALADGWRGHGPRFEPRYQSEHWHGSDWVAPLIVLGVAGAMLSAAASQPSAPPVSYAQPPVVYAQPQVSYAAPPVSYAPLPVTMPAPAPAPMPVDVAYFCRSSGQFHPYVQYCPEGWQLVAPVTRR